MKKILCASILSLVTLVSSNVFAESKRHLPALKNVNIDKIEVAGSSSEETDHILQIRFSFASCLARKFRVDVTERKSTLALEVIDSSPIDCMGPSIEREYTLLVEASSANVQFVVLNPIAVNVIAIHHVDQGPCTQNIGVLINPETRECRVYRNGCQETDLRGIGFIEPVGSECSHVGF